MRLLCVPVETAQALKATTNTNATIKAAWILLQLRGRSVGDLSGKNGLLQPTVPNGRVFTMLLFIDRQPAYEYNYNMSTVNSLPWHSVVFHCPNAPGMRVG